MTETGANGMKGRRVGPLLLFLPFLAACSTTWRLQTVQAPYALQWPFQPSSAKLTYLRSLTGLAATPSAGAVLAAVVVGGERTDANAFILPVAVATARDGRIAVADMGRSCVHLFLPSTARYIRLTGPKDEPIRTPVAVVFDDGMRLFVSDSSGSVYAFGPDGIPLFTVKSAGGDPLQRPTGLAWNAQRKVLYVVDTLAHTIYALDTKGDVVQTIGGRGSEEGRFNFPTHIVWTRKGELVVADSLNFRIQILDDRGKALGSFGRHGDGSGDLAMPKGLAVDKDGVIYVADSLFDVVQLFDRQGTFLLTLGRRGTDFGEFWMPAGVFIDESDQLYVCDTYNHRIQVFRISERYADALR
ncbi:MAG TPA: 6-bladed beta-propeller [Thermoanaerobaculia bacterium]|nr:6-bladed beta-propeller [Thermoanaerobaculia bacterium]